MTDERTTTIAVSNYVWSYINSLKQIGDSMNDVMERIVEHLEIEADKGRIVRGDKE